MWSLELLRPKVLGPLPLLAYKRGLVLTILVLETKQDKLPSITVRMTVRLNEAS
jgi:hypothetical protein